MSSAHLIADIPVKALIRKDVRILLVEELSGKWALPGGRIHVGEQPEEGLHREVMEEIGVTIEIGRIIDSTVFISPSSAQAHCVIVFEATLEPENQQFTLQEAEVKSTKWVTIEQALEMNLRPEYRLMFERM